MFHPAASLFGVSLSLLFISSRAFLEVGVSSYLENTVYHVSETKWTLVKPWTVTPRKGFFEATASRGEGFHDRFHTPESGIYFIALNLQMANATAGFLKASLVINGELEEANGFQGVYGKTNLTETVSLSGFLRLYENDVLALYLHGSAGSLLRDSTFSVMQMSRIGAVPGFHAVLSRRQLIQPQVISRLESWRTSGTKGLFSMHTGTSPSVGLFCAILEGIYQFSSNINMESDIKFTDGIIALVLNSKITLAKRYLSGTKNYSSSISGMFQLNRGDCVEMRVKFTSGGHVTILSGSSFSGLFLGLKREFAQQFSASLLAQNKLGSHVGWDMADHWTINSSRRNFQSQEMILKTNHSTFIANDNGLFLVTALINVNSSSRTSKHLLVAINDPPSGLTGNNGLSAGKTFSSSRGSLIVSGVVWLDKGDAVTVYVHSNSNDSDVVDGLFCVSVISYDWPGVTVTLTESISLNTSEWTKVTTWKTHGVPGLFSFDNAFFPASGIFQPRQEGTYFVSCNVIFKGGGKGNLSVVIAIDDLIDTGNGLYALNENPKPVVTLNVAGSIRLKMSQTVSVYVKTTISSSWDVSYETGFSVMLIGADSLTTPGFFAVKQEEANQSSSCGEIGRWRTVQPVSDTFFKTSAQFNSTSGRFKADEDGFYLTSANILIRHSGTTQISMTIELGGQGGQRSRTVGKTFQPRPSNLPGGGFVSTLTLASAGRLERDQYVSIFIDVDCRSGSHWKVLTNSSFSVVLASRWESDYTAGFVATNDDSEFANEQGFVEVVYWTDPNLFTKNLEVPSFDPATIENSGLYFLSSVVILKDIYGGKTFHSGVCIDDEIAFNGITASKVSEGNAGNFAVSAFGVLYLRKGQKIYLCVSSGLNKDYKKEKGSWFSLVRFLPLRQPPGLHQMLQRSRNTSGPCEWSVVRSMSTGGGQLAYINNNIFHPNYPTLSCDKGDFTPYFDGAYLISVWFTLRGNLPDTVTACIGRRKCAECYVEISNTVKQYNNTFGLVGLVDLKKGEPISMCLKSSDHTFSILTATRSVQFLSGVELNRTFQLIHGSLVLTSSGWHALADWETNSNKPVEKFDVIESGLYILSINLQLEVDIERLVGVKLEATGSSNREVLSILSNFEADSTVSYSMAVVARLNASEAIAVSIYSNIKSLSMRNARFFAALVEKSNQFYCLSLRAKTSRYNSGDWWKPIEHWLNGDTQCVSTRSSFSKGIFVADVAGVYFLTAVVVVKTSGLSQQTRLVELLLAVNGDTFNNNGLTATKSVSDSSSVVLSVSATAYLEPWQTLSLMIRSTGVGAFDVASGSMFSVVLLEEAKYYKTVAPNITDFDNGPRVVRHPPPSVSLGDDLGLNVSWSCDAVAEGNVAYSWLKNDQNITSSRDLSLENVQASDSGRYVCLAEYDSIKVFSQASELDVFDTSPQFQNKVFIALENSNASLELTFSALDKQRRPANISLNIIKGDTNNPFELSRTVSKENFTLRNRIPLDYETINSYLLTLLAINQDTNKTTTVNVTVNISDVNDNPPIFTSRSYNVSVEENAANGTVIFQAKATDEDSGNNSIITYTLLSRECDDNFFVDASSGNVTVTGNLDHETRSEVILCIQATDGKFRTTTKLVITVLDVNEFAPVFNPQFYQRRISETALVGEPVIQVFATDKDSGTDSSIFYNITGGNVDGTFSIDPENGTIVLLKSLDYETQLLYELHIQASDGKFSAGANVSIRVVDYNDNSPEFGQASFSFSVPENVTTGHRVGNVSASDIDSNDNTNIHYSISSVGNYDKFTINSSTGDIFTATKLDAETLENYVILVTANDTGNPSRISTTLVTVTATDVNDNVPEFVQRNFTVNISEASVLGTNIVCLSTTDPDSMRHSEITYSIANGNVDDTFKVTAEGVVVLQKQLDRETVDLYNLTIVAGNSGATVPQSHVPAIVIINVVDVNDNSPVFQKLNYSFTVPENITARYFVGSVKASDIDSFDNAHISYSIPSLRDHNKFWINTSTGDIYTNGALDYETAENYAILVEAHDSGHPPRMAVTLVNIAITDANDNSPEFVDRYLQVNVSEASTIGTQIVCLSTTDRDSMQHARTSFNISKGNINNTFGVTDEGVVVLWRHLDRETISIYNLTIDAVDSDSSQLKSSKSAVVIIYVEDINDNFPVFTKNSYSAEMLENVPIGYTVINVTAHDKDKGSNGVVTYSLFESPWATDELANNIFTVNDITGAISTLKKLKLNASQVEYKFQVKASDKGIPSLESFTNVLVTVKDTNDSPPKFTDCPTKIKKVSAEQTEMFRVSTIDADHGSNANVTYSIVEENINENCPSENGVFKITHNGRIYKLKELQAGCSYSINISATDGVGFDFCSVDVQVMAEQGTNAPQTDAFPEAGKIAVIVIGFFLSLILVLLVVFWFLRRKNRREAPVTYAKHAPVLDNLKDLPSDTGGESKHNGTCETTM